MMTLNKIACNEAIEGRIFFIHFRDGKETKWAHAMIDSIDKETIRFRTAAGAKQIQIKIEDVLDIGEDEIRKIDEEIIKALYRGEIYVEGKNETEKPYERTL